MDSSKLSKVITKSIQSRLASSEGTTVVMVTGPPATGKSTICELVAAELGGDVAHVLCDDREIYPRQVREQLQVSGIDHRARDMAALKADLSALSRGVSTPHKVYLRRPGEEPRIEIQGVLAPRRVIILDGFAWSYDDFDGMWDLKFVLLPYAYRDSELMSVSRDLKDRYYLDTQAQFKHHICYQTYWHNRDRLRNRASQIFRASSSYSFVEEGDVSRDVLPDLQHGQPLVPELVMGHEELAPYVQGMLKNREYLSNILLMCKFRDGDARFDVLRSTIAKVCTKYHFNLVVADRPICDNLWDNVRCHMLASNRGIAVFDSLDGEPPSANVFIESGFMLGRQKSLLCLVQSGLDMPANYIGRLVRHFDGTSLESIAASVERELQGWLTSFRHIDPQDQGLSGEARVYTRPGS